MKGMNSTSEFRVKDCVIGKLIGLTLILFISEMVSGVFLSFCDAEFPILFWFFGFILLSIAFQQFEHLKNSINLTKLWQKQRRKCFFEWHSRNIIRKTLVLFKKKINIFDKKQLMERIFWTCALSNVSYCVTAI